MGTTCRVVLAWEIMWGQGLPISCWSWLSPEGWKDQEDPLPQGGPATRLDMGKRACSFLQEGLPPGGWISYRASLELKDNFLSENSGDSEVESHHSASRGIIGSPRQGHTAKTPEGTPSGHTLEDDHNRVYARSGIDHPPHPPCRKSITEQHERRK